MRRRHAIGLLIGLVFMVSGAARAADASPDAAAKARAEVLRGCRGTYGSPPRRADKHVDTPLLLSQLKELGANTYNWLIWSQPTDWEDLQAFLPKAREQGVSVWVTLVPPSESPPKTRRYSEPFRVDYDKWAAEIAKLSVAQPNLVAWSVDDFVYNTSTFTPEKMRQIIGSVREVNPRLAFVPVVYWRQLKPELSAYRDVLDGILYPYRNDSVQMNLTDTGTVKPEVEHARQVLGGDVVVIVDVYQTKHSRTGPSTPQYVREVIANAHAAADGVMIYTHPNPTADPEKYRAVREGLQAAGK